MKYSQIPTDTFQNLVLNAGILATDFDPDTGVVNGLIGATTGGLTFNANPTFSDWGEDIDNCPNNTAELKRIDAYDPAISGTFVTLKKANLQMLVGAGNATGSDGSLITIIPSHKLVSADFQEIWFIGDYSDANTGDDAGFLAIHLMRGLNTSGFQITTSKNAKDQFAFEFHGHYTIDDIEEVPFEVYLKAGTDEEGSN